MTFKTIDNFVPWLTPEKACVLINLLLKKDFNRTILFFLSGARNEAYNLYVSDAQQTKKSKETIG